MATRSTASSGRSGRASTARPQAVSRGTASPDVIAVIKSDHTAVKQLFRRYQSLGERAYKGRRQMAERIIKELSVHAAVEEQVLYPNAKAGLPNGERLVNEAIAEHQELKQSLTALDKCSPQSPEFDELMARVEHEVRNHVREEEAPNGILALLRKHASREELHNMADLVRLAKRAAPTRPHPKTPSTPPANVILGA